MLKEAYCCGLVKTPQNERAPGPSLYCLGHEPALCRYGGLQMHTIQTAMPDSRLTPFVRCFAQREISAQTSSLAQTSLAQLEHTLAFYLRGQPTMDYWSGNRAVLPRIHFVGTQTRSPGCAYFTGHVLAFGIFLKPFASWQLFRIPPAQFADQSLMQSRCSDGGSRSSGSSSPSAKPFLTISRSQMRCWFPSPRMRVL